MEQKSAKEVLEEADITDVFSFFFGLLRQSIWKVSPEMKKVMLGNK